MTIIILFRHWLTRSTLYVKVQDSYVVCFNVFFKPFVWLNVGDGANAIMRGAVTHLLSGFVLLLLPALNSSVNWRLSAISPSPNHYVLGQNEFEESYFIPGYEKIFVKRLDGQNDANNSWIFNEKCLEITNKENVSMEIICPTNGKYKLGIRTRCPGNECWVQSQSDSIDIRINELPFCYFWHVAATTNGATVDLQIKLHSMGQHANSRPTEVITKLFKARNVNPALMSLADKPIELNSLVFNESAVVWQVSFPIKVLAASPYLKVLGGENTAIMGCGIAQVVYLTQLYPPLNHSASQVPLVGISGSKAKIYSHNCDSFRSLLVTPNGVVFTNEYFLSTSNVYLGVDLANTYGNIIQDAASSPHHIYLLINGTVLSTPALKHMLNFKLENITLQSVSFRGLSTSPLCIVSSALTNFVAWENSFVVAWTSNSIYIKHKHQKHWKQKHLPSALSESIIEKVQLSILPGKLALVVQQDSAKKILYCFHQNDQDELTNCSLYELPFATTTQDDVELAYLSSAQSSILVWTNTKIGYLFDNGKLKGTFDEVPSVQSVTLSHDHTKYILQTSENRLYYGSGESRSLLALRRTDPQSASNILYKFQMIGNRPIRIEWDNDNGVVVHREIFPLMVEVYAAIHAKDNGTFCDNVRFSLNFRTFKGNVKNLESTTDYIQVEVCIVHPASQRLDIELTENLNGLALQSDNVIETSTLAETGKTPLRIKTVKANYMGVCNDTTKQCPTGLATVGARVTNLDNDDATCLFPLHEILFINVTCPTGLHIRIHNQSGHSCGHYEEQEECILGMKDKPWLLEPTVELYSFDQLIGTVNDAVKFVEVNGRSGFELQDKNILTKDCYLCSMFREVNSSSELILQTPISACPCQMEKYGDLKWIGAITFENVVTNPGAQNDFNFEATVLGSSYCRLTTRFTVRLSASPLIEFVFWEYMVISIFVLISIVGLIISYHNYMKFMRTAKLKQA